MKCMNKITVALIALFCMGNLGAYTWNFDNTTDKTIVIRMGLVAHPHFYYNIVKPHEKGVKFEFGGALAKHCSHSIAWAEYNPNIKLTKDQTKGEIETQNGGLDVKEKYRPDGSMLDRYFGWLPYEYKDAMVVYLESDASKQMKEHAAQSVGILSQGAMKFADLVAKWPCEGRNFTIIDDKGSIVFATPIP